MVVGFIHTRDWEIEFVIVVSEDVIYPSEVYQ